MRAILFCLLAGCFVETTPSTGSVYDCEVTSACPDFEYTWVVDGYVCADSRGEAEQAAIYSAAAPPFACNSGWHTFADCAALEPRELCF